MSLPLLPGHRAVLYFALRLTVLGLCAIGMAACSASRSGSLSRAGEASQRSGPALQMPAGSGILPAPSQLLPAAEPREGSYTESDLFRLGRDYNQILPNSRVLPDEHELVFYPAGITGALGDLAYCCFSFSILGYDRNSRIHVDWSTVTEDEASWIGLAHWESNRWHWFPGAGEPYLQLEDIHDYIRPDGTLLLTVACRLSGQQRLASIRIGDLPALPDLTVSPESGFVPFDITLDASQSTPQGGAITKYEFDLDNDGDFEVDNGIDPVLETKFVYPGIREIRLRVSSENGLQATREVSVKAFAEWVHSFGGASGDQITAMAYDGHDAIYAAGWSYSFGGDADILLLRYDISGNLIWARSWNATVEDLAKNLHIDPDGNLILVGRASGGVTDAQNLLLQKWSPEGALLDSRYFDNAAQFFGDTSHMDGHTLYVSGCLDGFPNFGVVAYDFNSGINSVGLWTYDSSTFFLMNEMQTRQSIGLGLDLYVVGQLGSQASVVTVGKGPFDLELQLGNAYGLNAPSSIASSLVISGGIKPAVYVSGSVSDGTSVGVFVSELKLESNFGASCFSSSGSIFNQGMSLIPGGGYLLGSYSYSGSTSSYLHSLGPDGTEVFAEQLSQPGFDVNLGSRFLSLGGGYLSAGTTGSAHGMNFQDASFSAGSVDLGWSEFNLTQLPDPALAVVSFPGTVNNSLNGSIDFGGGDVDGLIICRRYESLE